MDPKQTRGFTIVELLIVIVVIAILAAISVVAYNGIQVRARDTQRKADISAIVKSLELYHAIEGVYPTAGGSHFSGSWSTTADASWATLETRLKPHISKLPTDPISTPNANILSLTGYNYAYFRSNGGYCDAEPGQVYILVYRLEGSEQDQTISSCPTTSSSNLGPYGGGSPPRLSNYRVVK